MIEEATRPILWNVSSLSNVITMYALLALFSLLGLIGIYRHVEMWRSGTKSADKLRPWWHHAYDLLTGAVLQKKVVRSRAAGASHTLVYVGFLMLLLTTTVVFIDHDFGIEIYRGWFYIFLTIGSDLLGLGLLFGVGMFAHRRYITKPHLLHSRFADSFMLVVLALLVVQGFLLEGLRIHGMALAGEPDKWAHFSPIGLLVAKFFWSLSAASTSTLHFLIWWFHTITVFACFTLVPYTKFFHIIASSVNIMLSGNNRAKGALSYPGDIETMIEAGEEFSLGLESIKDYSWKQLLDLDACTSCGRCQDACPAYLSGKPLSPKWLILDTRNHAISLNNKDKLTDSHVPSALRKFDDLLSTNLLIKGSGVNGDNPRGRYRAPNEAVQENVISIGQSADARIAGEVLSQDVFWSCTTCMACVEACPVGINHVDQIVENRRNMALMHGEIPSEAQQTLRALETRGNPFGAPEARFEWAKDLDLKVLKPGEEVDYLYWVGCVSSYDQRKQKIAQALVTLLTKAGVNFAILGNAESCTGDPARRLGEENLFQTLAKKNLAVLGSVRFEKLVANCPHCFNTLKNEYPQIGNLGEGREPEIIHHSVLLRELLAEEKLIIKEGKAGTITFHDPCYLGRYNDEYEAPRDTLKAVPSLKIVEMDRSKEKGMCCGAGGGHFWMDLKQGERVNVLRTEQAAETGANTIATGCPFCLQMMEDGVKLTDREGSMDVRDIAEVLLDVVE